MAASHGLRAQAPEFVPAQQQTFRHEFPSLVEPKLQLPARVLSFEKVKAPPQPPQAPAPPPPTLPDGFDRLQPKAVKPPEPVAIESPPPVALEAKDERKKKTKKKNVKTSKAQLWRERSKVRGDITAYEGEYTSNEWSRPKTTTHVAAPLPVASTHAASTHATAMRTEWRSVIWPMLGRPTLTRADLDVIHTYLSQHRSLLLWDERDEDKRSIWHLAAMSGHIQVLDCLQAVAPDGLGSRDRKKQTPLHVAAQYGHVDAIKFLVQHGADAMAIDKKGNTPLHHACRALSIHAVRALLSKSKLEARNKSRETPLLVAIIAAVAAKSRDSLDVVSCLLRAGANATVHDHSLQTALYLAMPSPALVELVLVHGYPSDATLLSPLQLSVSCGYVTSLSLVLPIAPSFALHQTDKVHGDSLLHLAVRFDCVACVDKVLSAAGKKLLLVENAHFMTPVVLAVQLGRSECLRALLGHGGYPNERDRQLRSPLLLALMRHDYACVEVLMGFECAVDVACIDFIKAHHAAQQPPPSTLLAPYTVYASSAPTDGILSTLDGTYHVHVHQAVLVGRSPVLRALWAGSWATSGVASYTVHAPCDVVELFVSLVYAPNVAALQAVSAKTLWELLCLANELLVQPLEALCVWSLVHWHEWSMDDAWDPFRGALLTTIPDKTATEMQALQEAWRAADMDDLLADAWLSDIDVVDRDGGRLRCHRAVLAAQSTHLQRHFETHDQLTLACSQATAYDAIVYLYTRRWRQALMVDDLLELLTCSIGLETWDLTRRCEADLMHKLAPAQAEAIYAVACAFSNQVPNLKTACRIVLLESLVASPVDRKELILSCLLP
ncbi:hypothetical protein SPRG_04226 [Saprolegnia parasitica CBS 223.65]|uniref:BTB domain-containing protein n=1 Tax=Saprolegnia parasitica (strain CBS 223.65) TaxID=695850 RepID=A0A067CJX3_SAPPC|nr:hypothetical protein SPRG_04226 [Saprolegnia parasitica CBS 223.65]KDO31039.1 hypothetical protein SPRG_04226 [Saprolegnia parasitica CBS 223.65]|eukprot:XP_012198216.1 hypothetical protein SPRG_04226 [Saprolegnia parasitica CBS 223.65]